MTEFVLGALRGKKVLVVGLARSGIAAAKLLCAQGIFPLLQDTQGREALLAAYEELEGLPCGWHLGEDAVALLPQCDAVVISPGVPVQSPVVSGARRMGLPLIGELELGAMCLEGQLAAITGTNGKTTTTTLLGEMLKNSGRRTHVAGNIGVPLTSLALESKPEDVSVVEVSSFQLETVHHFAPDVAALLNLSHDHLNRHGTFEVYVEMKKRIFQNQHAGQTAVLNADDPVVCAVSKGLAAEVRWFSSRGMVQSGADVRNGWLCLSRDGDSEALLPTADVSIPGPHNLENAMAAAVMADTLGVSSERIAHTLRTFQGVEHRMEQVAVIEEVRYINDSKGTNVDATEKAILAMERPTVILLGGSDKGVSFQPLAARVVTSPMIREVVVLGETGRAIEEALRAEGFSHVHSGGGSMENAVRLAASLAGSGWNVLLSPACASYDMFQDYEHRGRVFKQAVLDLR